MTKFIDDIKRRKSQNIIDGKRILSTFYSFEVADEMEISIV